ncbi:BQ5605_C013g07265 [Microbotryum silenes-dioicae]|uniref:BQ5605_C013g07265 protein n=1 Tax=Microbotryum silenes-dioicae TaxID=796604 RepID=A0A2X0LRK1_9BASI|nr:BQ5605_C013g07265 [Microbotryum silenes-dioicae]
MSLATLSSSSSSSATAIGASGPAISSSRHASSLLSSSVPNTEEPTPTDLLLATPPAVLKFLTLAAPVIHGLTFISHLINWEGHFFSSLLLLLAWWAVCLFGEFILRYGAPALVLAYILFTYLGSFSSRPVPGTAPNKVALTRSRHRQVPLTPAAFHSLLHSSQILANDVQSLRAELIHPLSVRLSFVPTHPGRAAPAYHTAWIVLTSYPFYLALTYFVPMRLIFLAIGSVGLLWNAPFFQTLRVTLWSSAFVRWIARIAIALITGGRGLSQELRRTRNGVGIPGLLRSKKQAKQVVVVQEKPVKVRGSGVQSAVGLTKKDVKTGAGAVDPVGSEEDVQVQFTIFENQRWWVGLDWTHALLPGERASWTDVALHPAIPPVSFVLPPGSVTYTSSPTRSDPTSRLKRTTEWKWLDTEWRVMRSSSAQANAISSSAAATNADGSIIANASSATNAHMPRSPSLSAALQSYISSTTKPEADHPSTTGEGATGEDDTPLFPALVEDYFFENNYHVDNNGWAYSDNSWEHASAKGGLGKYTRRRAWVRRAHLVERVERVGGPVASAAAAGSGAGSNSSGTALGTSGVGLRSAPVDGGVVGTRDKEGGSLRRRKSSKSLRDAAGSGAVMGEKENFGN